MAAGTIRPSQPKIEVETASKIGLFQPGRGQMVKVIADQKRGTHYAFPVLHDRRCSCGCFRLSPKSRCRLGAAVGCAHERALRHRDERLRCQPRRAASGCSSRHTGSCGPGNGLPLRWNHLGSVAVGRRARVPRHPERPGQRLDQAAGTPHQRQPRAGHRQARLLGDLTGPLQGRVPVQRSRQLRLQGHHRGRRQRHRWPESGRRALAPDRVHQNVDGHHLVRGRG
jgi:hypothetical protein